MVMMDSKELARLRKDLEAVALPDVGNILSLTKTRDGQGGITETWGTAYANVSCRLDLVQRNFGVGVEEGSAASLKPFSTWILTLPHNTSISTANRFEFGSDNYTVVEVNTNSSWRADVRATLEKI